MEEILASIRRIISEDDAPAADAGLAAVKAPAEDDVFEAHDAHDEKPAHPQPAHEDVLELTQRVEPAPPPAPEPSRQNADESVGDLDVFNTHPEPVQAPPPRRIEPEPEPESISSWKAAGAEVDEDAPLIADHKAEAAANHFGSLVQNLAMPAGGRSLEDVVRELLRPLLKEWLDANLQQIVETRVQAEVERISRRRVY